MTANLYSGVSLVFSHLLTVANVANTTFILPQHCCAPDCCCCWRGVQSGWDCFGYEYNRPTKDVVIRNVTAVYSEAAGCAIGSEMSGGMQNITVRDKYTIA